MDIQKDLERTLLTENEIQNRIVALAEDINRDYHGKPLIVICILRGSVIFMADLIRKLNLPLSYDFMAVSSYGDAASTSGTIRINYDIKTDIKGKDILIVEDIIDTGRTLDRLKTILQAKEPASLRIITLLDKPERREVEVTVDYVGFTIPDEFVVGYGLDYANRYRNLPYIAVLKREVYS